MFSHLHVHDAKGSLLDSILKVEDIAKFAKDNNQQAIAITNHGYMTSYVDFFLACKKYGVKPIIGNEVYEVDDMFEMKDTKDYQQPRYHLILLASNQEGFKNLIKITSVSCTDGFYKKPRIDLSYIKKNKLGNGIICLTACQAGRLSKYLDGGKEEDAKVFVDNLKSIFDYVACEIQSHDTEEQSRCNKLIYNFSQKYKLPYVITTDAHMLNESLLESHALFVEINEDRDTGEMYSGCYLQTEEQIYTTLDTQFSKETIKVGIEETQNIVKMIQDIDIGVVNKAIMPKIKIGEGFSNNKEYLRYLVYKTFDEKFGYLSKEEQEKRKNRIETELPVLYEVDYTDYFIMLYMLAKEARKRKIPIGYSRGSGANCLCLFMLNVTQIDSVRWNLDFSRFANLGRRSMADFDWDISKKRRKEFVEISEELFGKNNVAPIATFNTLSTKVAIRDIGKVLNERNSSPYYGLIPYSLRDSVAKMIPTIKTLNDLGEEEEKDMLLKDILNKNKKLKEVYDKFPLWFKYVMDVEGLPKSMGRHAAGTLITPKPITEYCPLCYDSEKNVMIQLEMHNAMDTLGLCKMDFLGLETLDIIDNSLKLAGLTWNDVDINHLDLEDKEVYDNIYKKGNTVGIFQMESYEAKKMCIEAQANNIEDIIVVNSANRPGTKDSFPDYCKNKLHPEEATVLHEDLKELFKQSKSVLLYQEQALSLLRYAYIPENDIDNGRRAIGKKDIKKMNILKPEFEKGLVKRGWSEQQIEEIWNLLLKQSSYCFNRGHAVAYSLLSYLTAYLKTHYTIYYMSALLSSKADKVSKISLVIDDCKRLGIKVLPPNVNLSGKDFTAIPEKNEILFGLLAVKGLGESMVDKIINNRRYKSFNDFIKKISDKKTIITLIKAGALPVKDKMQALRRYADGLFERKEYTPVVSLPSYKKLLLDWDIDKEDYYISPRKYDKTKMLKDYNLKKEELFKREQLQKYKDFMNKFKTTYAKDEYLWEFETLSMFLTKDPLKESYKYITRTWESIEDDEEAVILCVVVDIKRKKDKNGNQFAYLDLYTPYGIIEATIWSSQLKKYSELIKKGACLAMLGRKREGGHFFVSKVKTYNQWLVEKKKHGINKIMEIRYGRNK